MAASVVATPNPGLGHGGKLCTSAKWEFEDTLSLLPIAAYHFFLGGGGCALFELIAFIL